MDDNFCDEGSDSSIDWSSDDDMEIANTSSPSSVCFSTNGAIKSEFEVGESSSCSNSPSKLLQFTKMGFPEALVTKVIAELGEKDSDAILETLLTYSSSSTNSPSKLLHFIKMGFPEALVTKVIAEIGEKDSDAILDTLLTYTALDEIPNQEQEPNNPCLNPVINFEDDFSDLDTSFSDEDSNESLEKDDPLICLIELGYPLEEASAAISRCGKDTPLSELIDFISAAHISREADSQYNTNTFQSFSQPKDKKRKSKKEILRTKSDKKPERKRKDRHDQVLPLPNPMIGYGVPNQPFHKYTRPLPTAAMGPPFFYYENVACTPRGVWNKIKAELFDIQPEFVDSKFLCCAARKRGYIHNLPLENRFPIQPLQHRTIFKALPDTKNCWPSWDKREQLNCILTCVGSAQLTEKIRLILENNGDPSVQDKKFIIGKCRKWNLVWTGKGRVAPLEPDEIESLMGYPKNHTRGVSRCERYKGLGNSFQVDTVAYHLSVLKEMYPNGMNVLSLFSGIGGAEVALHRLGIRMKNVVSVEKSDVCRKILKGWWEETNQRGNLVHVEDVAHVTRDKLEGWIGSFGGFDLVIGGSPCNNLAGGNRRTRDGLEGQHSSLFFDYPRILKEVKSIMSRN